MPDIHQTTKEKNPLKVRSVSVKPMQTEAALIGTLQINAQEKRCQSGLRH